MNKEEYIESGLLELYVAGALSDKENQELYEALIKHPELLQEVVQIEAAILKLTAAISEKPSDLLLNKIKEKLDLNEDDSKIVRMENPRSNWLNYVGWAAAVIFAVGFLWKLNQINELENQIKTADTKRELLEDQLENTNANLNEADDFIAVVRDKNITAITLGGQGVSPDSYAKVYWDKSSNQLYLDAAGLPEPPEGKVYQFWSLTLDPLTPTDMGVIEEFASNEDKIFKIPNPNESEAFGITLEPEGGSVSPTLDQLYVLGTVSS